MRTGRLGITHAAVRTNNSMILFWVGPYRMGIAAGALKEIRNDQGHTASELGYQAILSTHALLGVPAGPANRLLVLRPGRVAVRVDRVERMIETSAILPLPKAFKGAEREWYFGFVLDGEMIVPVMNPETLEREALLSNLEILTTHNVPQDVSQEAASI